MHETWGLDLTNPAADWTPLPDFPGSNNASNVDGAGRQELASIVVNNEIYAWGGFNYTAPFAYADGYRLSHAGGVWAWDALPSLPHAVSSPGITAVGDFIYSVGGADYDSTAFYTETDRNGSVPDLGAKFHQLDTTNLAAGWTALPELSGTARWVHATAAVGDQIYVFGGATGGPPYRSVVDNWRYDPIADAWERLRDTPVSVSGYSTGTLVYQNRYVLLLTGYPHATILNPDGTSRPRYGTPSAIDRTGWKHHGKNPASYENHAWAYDAHKDLYGTVTFLPFDDHAQTAHIVGDTVYLFPGETGGFYWENEYFGHAPEFVLKGKLRVRND